MMMRTVFVTAVLEVHLNRETAVTIMVTAVFMVILSLFLGLFLCNSFLCLFDNCLCVKTIDFKELCRGA